MVLWLLTTKSRSRNQSKNIFTLGFISFRTSLIYFACIGVASLRLVTWQRDKSRESNSNAGKIIKFDLYYFLRPISFQNGKNDELYSFQTDKVNLLVVC